MTKSAFLNKFSTGSMIDLNMSTQQDMKQCAVSIVNNVTCPLSEAFTGCSTGM